MMEGPAPPAPPTDHDTQQRDPQNPFLWPFYRVVTDGSRRTKRVRVERSAATVLRDLPMGPTYHTPLSLHKYSSGEISIYTDIGGRKAQEDRFTFNPRLGGREDCALMGVFDGTVGDFASDNVKSFVVPHLLAAPSWLKVINLLDESKRVDVTPPTAPTPAEVTASNEHFEEFKLFPALADAVDEMYLGADSELVSICATHRQHYASSTSVVAILAANCCAIGHLGDSRAALGHFGGDEVFGNFITDDHKPNQFYERTRIRHSGGSVEYLHNHNNKPFIRGGDFAVRKARGEQPMQLQYSRAFGGKDLKGFGLSNEPDIICFRIEPFHCCLILASDGLWDVLEASAAVRHAVNARLQGRDPARELVEIAMGQQDSRRQTADNVTALVHFFNTVGNAQAPEDAALRQWLSQPTPGDT